MVIFVFFEHTITYGGIPIMNNLENRIESIENQLSGIRDLLKTLVVAHNSQEEQTLLGIKAIAETMSEVLLKLESQTQHNS